MRKVSFLKNFTSEKYYLDTKIYGTVSIDEKDQNARSRKRGSKNPLLLFLTQNTPKQKAEPRKSTLNTKPSFLSQIRINNRAENNSKETEWKPKLNFDNERNKSVNEVHKAFLKRKKHRLKRDDKTYGWKSYSLVHRKRNNICIIGRLNETYREANFKKEKKVLKGTKKIKNKKFFSKPIQKMFIKKKEEKYLLSNALYEIIRKTRVDLSPKQKSKKLNLFVKKNKEKAKYDEKKIRNSLKSTKNCIEVTQFIKLVFNKFCRIFITKRSTYCKNSFLLIWKKSFFIQRYKS